MIKCQWRHNKTCNSDLRREEIRDLKVDESKEIRISWSRWTLISSDRCVEIGQVRKVKKDTFHCFFNKVNLWWLSCRSKGLNSSALALTSTLAWSSNWATVHLDCSSVKWEGLTRCCLRSPSTVKSCDCSHSRGYFLKADFIG